MTAARNRTLDITVAVTAATVLVCSFLPWTADDRSRASDAWQGSVIWPLVVCLALAAALSWLLARSEALRAVGAAAAAGTGVCALVYAAVEPVTRVEPPGYVGIGMVASLALLIAGDGLRRRSSIVQVLLAVGGGLLVTLCVLPWALRPVVGGVDLFLWSASAVWAVTVAVVLLAVTAVLIRDSRSTRLLAALPAAIAAGWALAFTLSQPDYHSPRQLEPTTVAIAKFTSGPRLESYPFEVSGVVDYAVVACVVMMSLAVVLLVAAVAGVRGTSARER